MSKPFFSVIVPAHNSAEYIQRGLQSIVSQSFTDYELIVVCDACTDNTKL
jgi:glycosyltransferase involved in cell wall biosynthesis